MSTSYHEVYVHQARPHDAVDSEIQILNSSAMDQIQQQQQPPAYSQSLIELEEAAASSTAARATRNTNTSGSGPPTYDEAIDPPPPSYDSLFGRVREARKSSKGLMDFAKNVLILLLGTLGCTIILCVTIVIPVCMIVFGTLYMYDCPQGEYIPVYLLVGGGFGVLKQLMNLSTRVRSREDQEAERLRQSPTQQLINCFMFGWFIIGSFWIFKEYQPNYDPSKGKYCNKSLYMFAFWLITSVYIALGLLIFGLCAIAIGSVISHRRNSNHTAL